MSPIPLSGKFVSGSAPVWPLRAAPSSAWVAALPLRGATYCAKVRAKHYRSCSE